MNQTRVLWLVRGIRWMMIIGALAVVYVMVMSFMPAEFDQAGVSESQENRFADVLPGNQALKRDSGKMVWVSRFDDGQITQLTSLNAYVGAAGCAANEAVCVLDAETTTRGVLIRYTDIAPANLPGELPFYGGYVNPRSGQVYDASGRAYNMGIDGEPLTVVTP